MFPKQRGMLRHTQHLKLYAHHTVHAYSTHKKVNSLNCYEVFDTRQLLVWCTVAVLFKGAAGVWLGNSHEQGHAQQNITSCLS